MKYTIGGKIMLPNGWKKLPDGPPIEATDRSDAIGKARVVMTLSKIQHYLIEVKKVDDG